jgi:hypothetical protein
LDRLDLAARPVPIVTVNLPGVEIDRQRDDTLGKVAEREG